MKDFEEITSRENSRLKYARKVRDGKLNESIFVEGYRLCYEALKSGLAEEFCLVTRKFIDREGESLILRRLEDATKDIFIIEEDLMNSVGDAQSSQGIVLICKRPQQGKKTVESAFGKRSHTLRIVVYLHEINIPANLGSIFRTAEAAGVTGVIVSNRSCDPLSPKSIRGSMGSVFRLPLWDQAPFEEVMTWARQFDLRTTGTAGDGGLDYSGIDWSQPRLLIFGSEGHGLSQEHLELVADKITIPMENGVESLNLGVACGILLFEARRQSLVLE